MVRNSAEGYQVLRSDGEKVSSDKVAGRSLACDRDRDDGRSLALMCPQCGSSDLEQRGGKMVCPECYYTEPCCG
jgi:uncharacterized Zn finger protein (UPF0148 family)